MTFCFLEKKERDLHNLLSVNIKIIQSEQKENSTLNRKRICICESLYNKPNYIRKYKHPCIPVIDNNTNSEWYDTVTSCDGDIMKELFFSNCDNILVCSNHCKVAEYLPFDSVISRCSFSKTQSIYRPIHNISCVNLTEINYINKQNISKENHALSTGILFLILISSSLIIFTLITMLFRFLSHQLYCNNNNTDDTNTLINNIETAL